MLFSSPRPQFGQCCVSMSMTRLSNRPQLMRCGRVWMISTSAGSGQPMSLQGRKNLFAAIGSSRWLGLVAESLTRL